MLDYEYLVLRSERKSPATPRRCLMRGLIAALVGVAVLMGHREKTAKADNVVQNFIF